MPSSAEVQVPTQTIAAALGGGALSPLHAMLSRLELQTDARKLNLIVNHPDIHPWVRGLETGELDVGPVIAHEGNVCLLAEHGGVLFHKLQPGLYEAHSQCLPEGRGAWMVRCTAACLHWLFTHTDAVEVVTKCPEGNLAAKGLCRAMHLSHQFTNPVGWVMGGKPVPAEIYALTVQRWMQTAPGLVERGQWFHARLEAEFARHGAEDQVHPDDATHDRYVGAACEMIFGGQPGKGVVFYNRFALVGGYMPISMVSLEPLAFDIGNALVAVRGEELWVPSVRSLH